MDLLKELRHYEFALFHFLPYKERKKEFAALANLEDRYIKIESVESTITVTLESNIEKIISKIKSRDDSNPRYTTGLSSYIKLAGDNVTAKNNTLKVSLEGSDYNFTETNYISFLDIMNENLMNYPIIKELAYNGPVFSNELLRDYEMFIMELLYNEIHHKPSLEKYWIEVFSATIDSTKSIYEALNSGKYIFNCKNNIENEVLSILSKLNISYFILNKQHYGNYYLHREQYAPEGFQKKYNPTKDNLKIKINFSKATKKTLLKFFKLIKSDYTLRGMSLEENPNLEKYLNTFMKFKILWVLIHRPILSSIDEKNKHKLIKTGQYIFPKNKCKIDYNEAREIGYIIY